MSKTSGQSGIPATDAPGGAPASPSGSAGSAPSPSVSAADAAPIPGAWSWFIGRRAQAWDLGERKPITVMTDPQRAADGTWQVLAMFDDRPGYLTPLAMNYLWLKEPS